MVSTPHLLTLLFPAQLHPLSRLRCGRTSTQFHFCVAAEMKWALKTHLTRKLLAHQELAILALRSLLPNSQSHPFWDQ